MLFDSLTSYSESINLTTDSGATFPDTPSQGEFFFRTDENALYMYDGTTWVQMTGVTAASIPKITYVVITDSSYSNLDDTALGLSGGYIKIIGTGFETGCKVFIDQTEVTSTFSSSSEVRVQVGAWASGTKNIYVVNPDGATGVKVNGITFSSTPTWLTNTTLPSTYPNSQVSIQLGASDTISYVLEAGSTLPPGLTLSSAGLLSGTISSDTNTTYTFTILAIDAENQSTAATFSLSVLASDQGFTSTANLLKVSDVSATNNSTILDSSSNNFTVTRNGNVSQGAVSPFSNTGWSINYPGTGGNFNSIAANSAFNPRSGTTTFECWVFPTARSSVTAPNEASRIIDFYAGYNSRCHLSISSAGYLLIGRDNGTGDLFNISTTLIPLSQWTHIAWTWDGTSNKYFVNGQDVTSTFSNPTLTNQFPLSITTPAVYIGSGYYGSGSYTWLDPFAGYISNARLIKGNVLYTGNFAVPTQELTAVSGTVLLLNSTSRAKDASSNNFTVNTVGTVTVSALSPFSSSAIYDPAVNGGSLYFDGTGDYLNAGSNAAFAFGTGAYTVEFWVYPRSLSTIHVYVRNNTTGGWQVYWDTTSGLSLSAVGSSPFLTAGTSVFTVNQWSHVLVSRNSTSANDTRIFVNGVVRATGTDATNWTANGALTIGADSSGTYPFAGYISNARIVKGTALYTTNFTPSTAPLTAVSGTALLLSGTNAKIFDAASKTDLETQGTVTTSTTTVKFNKSIYFPASGSSLEFSTGPWTPPSNTDFTVEFWMNTGSVSTDQGLFGTRVSPDQSNNGIDIHLNASKLRVGTASAVYITGPTLTNNTWYHIAISRSGSNLRLFVNGQLQGTYATLQNHWYNRMYVQGVNTYMEEFRYSKFARYTSAFTVPTTTFAAK